MNLQTGGEFLATGAGGPPGDDPLDSSDEDTVSGVPQSPRGAPFSFGGASDQSHNRMPNGAPFSFSGGGGLPQNPVGPG